MLSKLEEIIKTTLTERISQIITFAALLTLENNLTCHL
jgi:hypothetical protein